jgi:hypothetical protein
VYDHLVLANADVDVVVSRARVLLATAEAAGNRAGVVFVRSIDPLKNEAALRRNAKPTTLPPLRSDVPFVGGAVVLTKRIVRRLLRWLFEPTMRQQRRFNVEVIQAALGLAAEYEALRRDHESLQLEVAHLRSQIAPPAAAIDPATHER